MKTKEEEKQIIQDTIAKLGQDSYLGPWLQTVLYELEAMMRADCFPRVSLADSQAEADKIVAKAEKAADAIIVRAKQEAEKREAVAESNVDCAITAIRKAQQVLLSIEERF